MALRRDYGLLLWTEVQIVVFYTVIEVQVVFETLLVLITSQLAIAGQLGREVHLWRIRLIFGSRGWRWGMEMTWRKGSWQIRLLEMDLPCSGKLWQYRRWKLFLASGSEI